MNRLFAFGMALCVSLATLTSAASGAAASDEWPTHWRVNGNGVTGTLEFTVGEGGVLTGRLLGDDAEGYVNGRHLVVRRAGSDRSEVWEGWLGQPEGEGSSLIVAGTISVAIAGHTRIYPWFGTLEGSPAASSTVPAKAVVPAAAAPVEKIEPAGPEGGHLSGKWTATEGQVEIFQDGKNLTVKMPDDSRHSGRMTGGDTLIIGLRKGCCNGELEGPDVILWSDGSRWRRSAD